jgi:hypothetical protein
VVVNRVSRREVSVFTPKKEGVGNEKTPFLTGHSTVIRHPLRPPWRLRGKRAHRPARQMYYWDDPTRREGRGSDAAKAERLRMWWNPRHDDGGMCPWTWYGGVQIPTQCCRIWTAPPHARVPERYPSTSTSGVGRFGWRMTRSAWSSTGRVWCYGGWISLEFHVDVHGRFWRFHADVKLKRFRVLSARNSTDKTDSTQVSRAAEFRARGVLSVWTASESE